MSLTGERFDWVHSLRIPWATLIALAIEPVMFRLADNERLIFLLIAPLGVIEAVLLIE